MWWIGLAGLAIGLGLGWSIARLNQPAPASTTTVNKGTPAQNANATPRAGCRSGGCNAELCGEPGDALASICVVLPKFQCYRTARCERQANGNCGWTQTPELQRCLAQYAQ